LLMVFSHTALMLICALFIFHSTAFASKVGFGHGKFNVGLTVGAFPNVDQREAQAAMQLWTNQLALGMGIKAEPRTKLYSNNNELLHDVNNGELSVVSIPALDYMQIRKSARMSPVLVSAGNGGYRIRYLLVTRNDRGIKKIRDLRGRSLLLASRKMQSASQLWLSVLMLREGIVDPARFFSDIKESISPSKALMNVFFGKTDALIISRSALETGISLNPQIGGKLVILAESCNLLGSVTCIPHNVSNELRRSIVEAALHLHETSIGRQMFTLFQMERTIPFKPSYLEGVESLLRERDMLAARLKKRK